MPFTAIPVGMVAMLRKTAAKEFGSSTGGGYEAFQRGWDAQVGPVAAFAPIMVTEIDWAPKKYDATWGKSITGTAGAEALAPISNI